MKHYYLTIIVILFLLTSCEASTKKIVATTAQKPTPNQTSINNDVNANSEATQNQGSNEKNNTKDKDNSSQNNTVASIDDASNQSMGVSSNNSVENSLTYTNTRVGFSITFPESWKGKYVCTDTDFGVNVFYKALIAENVSLFQVSLATKIQYAIDEAYVGFMTKLGERDSVVFIYFTPTGIPYDDKDSKYAQDTKAYMQLFNDKEIVLKTFEVLPGYDTDVYNKFISSNKKKDDSLKADYDKLNK